MIALHAWHTSLTQQQTRQIESIQKRALRIVFNSNCIDYENFRIIHQLQTLAERRTELCKSFFDKNVLDEKSCLHYLYFHHLELFITTDYGIRPSSSLQKPELHGLIKALLSTR